MPQTASQIRMIFVLYVWVAHVCIKTFSVIICCMIIKAGPYMWLILTSNKTAHVAATVESLRYFTFLRSEH